MNREQLIKRASQIAQETQEAAEREDFFAMCVVKEAFPIGEDGTKNLSYTFGDVTYTARATRSGIGMTLYTYAMQHTALESESFDPSDAPGVETAAHNFQINLRELWQRSFREKIALLCANRAVVRRSPFDAVPEEMALYDELTPRGIDFFGREVSPHDTQETPHGLSWVENRKYPRVAHQAIGFHPDIAHFLFPDPEKWIGEIQYRHQPTMTELDAETDVESVLPERHFFRAVLRVAAKPVRPDLGWVVTIVPPGFKGWLYYWAWKLVGIVP